MASTPPAGKACEQRTLAALIGLLTERLVALPPHTPHSSGGSHGGDGGERARERRRVAQLYVEGLRAVLVSSLAELRRLDEQLATGLGTQRDEGQTTGTAIAGEKRKR